MEIVVLKQAERELRDFPLKVRIDVQSLFERLADGEILSMPIARPLSSIAKGLGELRLSYKAGEVRVFYVLRVGDAIYVLHAAQKKKQTLDKKTRELLLQRMKREGIL
jgi:phage-related protein